MNSLAPFYLTGLGLQRGIIILNFYIFSVPIQLMKMCSISPTWVSMSFPTLNTLSTLSMVLDMVRMSEVHYLCKSICLSAGVAFLAPSCSLGALALPASRPPGLSWLPAALFLPLLVGLFRSSFLVALPWDSDLGRRPLLGLEGAGGPDSSTISSGFCWIFSAPAAATILFFPRSLLMLPWVGWSELIS